MILSIHKLKTALLSILIVLGLTLALPTNAQEPDTAGTLSRLSQLIAHLETLMGSLSQSVGQGSSQVAAVTGPHITSDAIFVGQITTPGFIPMGRTTTSYTYRLPMQNGITKVTSLRFVTNGISSITAGGVTAPSRLVNGQNIVLLNVDIPKPTNAQTLDIPVTLTYASAQLRDILPKSVRLSQMAVTQNNNSNVLRQVKIRPRRFADLIVFAEDMVSGTTPEHYTLRRKQKSCGRVREAYGATSDQYKYCAGVALTKAVDVLGASTPTVSFALANLASLSTGTDGDDDGGILGGGLGGDFRPSRRDVELAHNREDGYEVDEDGWDWDGDQSDYDTMPNEPQGNFGILDSDGNGILNRSDDTDGIDTDGINGDVDTPDYDANDDGETWANNDGGQNSTPGGNFGGNISGLRGYY